MFGIPEKKKTAKQIFWDDHYKLNEVADIIGYSYSWFYNRMKKNIPKGKIVRFGSREGVCKKWLDGRKKMYDACKIDNIIPKRLPNQ